MLVGGHSFEMAHKFLGTSLVCLNTVIITANRRLVGVCLFIIAPVK